MKINVSAAMSEVGSCQAFNLKIAAEELAITHGQMQIIDDILVQGVIVNSGRLLEVRGTISTLLREVCTRCLEGFDLPLNVEFEESFQQVGEGESEDNEDLNYFTGNEIDIAEAVRESLLLAQPLKPLCGKNCKGLCPHCGVNLNKTTCKCISENFDPRLIVLKKLLKK